MEAFVDKILTLYGPLGAGWLIAIFLWMRLTKVQDARIADQQAWSAEKTVLLDKGFTHMGATNLVLEGLKDRLGRSQT